MRSKPRTCPEAIRELLEEILADAPPGAEASARSEGEIERGPHPDKRGELHEDNWEAVKNEDGTVTIRKEHLYVEEEDQ